MVPIYDTGHGGHLLVKHEIEIDQQSVSGQPHVNQPSIAAAFQKLNSKSSDGDQSAEIAQNCRRSISGFERSRKGHTEEKKSNVCLAIDGLTLWRP